MPEDSDVPQPVRPVAHEHPGNHGFDGELGFPAHERDETDNAKDQGY